MAVPSRFRAPARALTQGIKGLGGMRLEEDIEALRRTALFGGIDAARLEVLAFTAARQRYSEGEILIERGDFLPGAFVVISGSATMLGKAADGTPLATRLDRGDLIGEMALMKETVSQSAVRAAGELEVLLIRRELFSRLIAEFPELGAGVARAAADRLERLTDDIQRLLGARQKKKVDLA